MRSNGTLKQIPNAERCIYCGQTKSIVWVHGHGQCAHCGINVDECCRGESCETEPSMQLNRNKG